MTAEPCFIIHHSSFILSPSLPRADASPPTPCQASALFGPRTTTDSPALRPLHSLPRSASPTSRCALAHSDGRKLPRQANHIVRALNLFQLSAFQFSDFSSEVAWLRPAKTPALCRELSQLSLHYVSRNWPTSLRRPFESDTSPSRSVPTPVPPPSPRWPSARTFTLPAKSPRKSASR
jgi:hypothetical protein